MATQDTIPGLPEKLQLELEEVARAQKRPVGDVLAEAVTAYLEERSWQRVTQSARTRTKAMGIKEDDVTRLIAESRAEQGHER
jgi:predicted transcriptional regulator